MGKIRIKTLGDEELEKEQEKKAKKRQEKKKLEKPVNEEAQKAVSTEGLGEPKGKLENVEVPQAAQKETPKEAKKDKKKKKKTPAKKRSMRYKSAKILIDKTKLYSLDEALDLLSRLQTPERSDGGQTKMATKGFDETVELHLNTAENGISGNFVLPHGSGKKTRVAVADDKIISDVEKGKIEFDVLLATPEFMPKLARVAKYLGPRGLMPNPKNGTLTKNPEDAAKKYEGGLVNFKTEAKSPIIHLSLGKISFGKEKLSENIKTALRAMPGGKIKKVILKSTMSPAIKLDFTKV